MLLCTNRRISLHCRWKAHPDTNCSCRCLQQRKPKEKTWVFMTKLGSDSLVEACPVTSQFSLTEWQVPFCTSHQGTGMRNLGKSLTVRTVKSSSTYTLSVSISSFMTWLKWKRIFKVYYFHVYKKCHRWSVQFKEPKALCDLINNQEVKAQEMTPGSGWRNTGMGQGLVRNKHHFRWCKWGECLPFQYI